MNVGVGGSVLITINRTLICLQQYEVVQKKSFIMADVFALVMTGHIMTDW